MASTVVICAYDPAHRAQARATFANIGWYIFECTFEDLASMTKSIKVDAIVVIGRRDGLAAMARRAIASADAPAKVVVRVGHATDAYDAVTRALQQVV